MMKGGTANPMGELTASLPQSQIWNQYDLLVSVAVQAVYLSS